MALNELIRPSIAWC